MSKKKKSNGCSGCFASIIFLIALPIIGTSIFQAIDTPEWQTEREQRREKILKERARRSPDDLIGENVVEQRTAWNFAKTLIVDAGVLKSPATAKFPFSPRSFDYKGDGVWEIRAYVDSQNGFGAMVRTEFTCTVVKRTDRYSLLGFSPVE